MDYSQAYSKQNIQRAIQRFNQLKVQYGQNAPNNAEFQNIARYLRATSQYQQMEMAKRQQQQQNNALINPGMPTGANFNAISTNNNMPGANVPDNSASNGLQHAGGGSAQFPGSLGENITNSANGSAHGSEIPNGVSNGIGANDANKSIGSVPPSRNSDNNFSVANSNINKLGMSNPGTPNLVKSFHVNSNVLPQPQQQIPQNQQQQQRPIPSQQQSFQNQPPNNFFNPLLSAEDTQLSKVQITAFKFLFKNQPLPHELYVGLSNHYNQVLKSNNPQVDAVALQKLLAQQQGLNQQPLTPQQQNFQQPPTPKQTPFLSQQMPQPQPQQQAPQPPSLPHQEQQPQVAVQLPQNQEPNAAKSPLAVGTPTLQANIKNNHAPQDFPQTVGSSVPSPVVQNANAKKIGTHPQHPSRPLIMTVPEPPILEDKIAERFPNSKLFKVNDPNLQVDAFSIPVINEKVPFNALTAPKLRAIAPGVVSQGIDPYSAHQIRESTISLKIDDAIRQLEIFVNDEQAGENERLEAEVDLNALKLLTVQKNLRGKYLSFTWFQNTLLSNTHPNFLAKIRKVELPEAWITSVNYEKQKSDLKVSKKNQKINKISNKLLKAQSLANQRVLVLEKFKRFGKAVVNYHANVEKEEQKRIERNAKQRLQALKANDEEAYIKLLDQTKDTRITHLLRQTNTFLQSLADSVKEQQKETRELSVSAGHSIETEDEFKKQFGEDTDSIDLDYYNVAHRYKETVVKQPSILVGGTLKEYQLKGLQWMVSLFNNHLNGILADEMGLGKTIQTISLITYLVEVKKVPGPFLVIVPLSTLTNWNLEFDKWAPSVKKITFKGSPAQRRSMHHDIRTGNFQILLTTFDYILKDRPLLAKVKWVHMIIDEGHRMKNTKSKLSYTLTTYYHTDYRLILTGTPLQNNLPELWALLNFVLPKIFNSVKSFDEWFNTPFANAGSQDKMDLSEEETLLVIRRLHKVLRPFLLRRLKKDVEKDLPNKIEKVIKCKMSALQQRLYRFMLDHRCLFGFDHQSNCLYTIKGNNNPIMQLKKIVNHPFVYDEIEDTINPTHETDNMIWRVSGKFEILDRILPKFKASGHRVLLFFQMTSIMTIMEDFLNLRGLKYLRLDGATKSDDRTNLLKVFNAPNSDYFAFLLSTRAGGLGLNLQTADTVIIFDTDWNPHQDLQAQDRAHRIGQKNEVRILRLITQDSVEEMVLERAHEKLDIDGKVIQAGKFDNKSTAEEQEALLRQLMEADDLKKGNNEEEEELTADELNEILARTDDEKVLFKQIDQKMEQDWKEYNKSRGTSMSRLYDTGDLPEYYKKEPDLKKDVVVDGARAKKKISYIDESLSEFEWSKANGLVLDEGNSVDDGNLGGGRKRRGRKRIKYLDEPALEEEDEANIDDEDPDDDEEYITTGRKRRAATVDSGNEESASKRLKSPSPSVKSKARAARGRGRGRGRGRSRSVKGRDSEAASVEFVELTPEERGKLQAKMKAIYNAVLNYNEVMTEYEDQPTRYLSELFKEKPSKKLYPDYYAIIKKPISLKEIKKKITGFNYYKADQLMNDLLLMFINAKTYNQEGSIVYNDAIKLENIAKSEYEKVEGATDSTEATPSTAIKPKLEQKAQFDGVKEESIVSNTESKEPVSFPNDASSTEQTSLANGEESSLNFSLDKVDDLDSAFPDQD